MALWKILDKQNKVPIFKELWILALSTLILWDTKQLPRKASKRSNSLEQTSSQQVIKCLFLFLDRHCMKQEKREKGPM